MAKIIKRPKGGLDLSNSMVDVAPMDYIDAMDIVDANPVVKNEKGYLQPNNNTAYAFDIGEAELTAKTYRITYDVTDLATCTININIGYSNFYNSPLPIPFTIGDDADALLSTIQTVFGANADLQDTVITEVSSVGDILVIDLSVTYFGYADYTLTSDNSLGDIYDCEALNDAVSAEKEGELIPIRLENADFNNQIFATTGTNKPQTFECNITVSGSDLIATFVDDPRIEDNEEVYIYPASGNKAAGYCIFESTGLLTYRIVASVNPITAAQSNPVGAYFVTRYKRTLSVIGYANKNAVVGTWFYWELVRSINLNFRTYKQIESRLSDNSDGLIYDFSDFLNPIRRLIYINGDYGVNTNGFLTVYNIDAIYSLDTIGTESILQTTPNIANVKLSIPNGVSPLGKRFLVKGAKPEACYAAFVRFKTYDGFYSLFSAPSNVIWTHSFTNVASHASGNPTDMSIQIDVSNIEAGLYEYAQVGVIEFLTDSYKSYLIPEVPLNGETEITIIDTGLQSGSYILFDATTLVEQLSFVFENARAILNFDNSMLAGNVNIAPPYDLTEWVADATVTSEVEEIDAPYQKYEFGTTVFSSTLYTDLLLSSNEYMSCMPHDTYRLALFVYWNNGSPTSVFNLGDFEVDAGDEITDTSYPTTKVYQYYFKVKGLDMDSILPSGERVGDVVKYFRFGRALVSPQVLATGVSLFLSGASAPYTLTPEYVGSTSPDPNIQLDKVIFISPSLQNGVDSLNPIAGDEVIANLASATTPSYVSPSFSNSQAFDYFGDTLLGNTVTTTVTSGENVALKQSGQIANLQVSYGGNAYYVRGCVALDLGASLPHPAANYIVNNLYYIRPYSGDPYPQTAQQTMFFVSPQDIYYDPITHDSSTEYKVFCGDCFPQKSYYKLVEKTATTALPNPYNNVIGFFSYNRGNFQLRSGRFPSETPAFYLEENVITEDDYTYDNCFTPQYLFQGNMAYNSSLRYIYNKFATLYYSEKGYGSDFNGGNRLWKPLSSKDLEAKYGAIIHMETLLGFSSNGLIVVLQERRMTTQFYDNTANVVTNVGEVLLGTGQTLGRRGADLTAYGCEHKWTAQKGQNKSGKDILYYVSFRNAALIRLGADGTGDIIGNLAEFLNIHTLAAYQNGYNEVDAPANNWGCHAVWDNIRKEYILTLRVIPELSENGLASYSKNEFVQSVDEIWGFEQFPVIYRSLVDDNTEPLGTPDYWEEVSGYSTDYTEFKTLVWNENDNTFKPYRSHLPRIYGTANNTIISSHPVYPSKIYEHNTKKNEALYYGTEVTSVLTAITNPTESTIEATGIGSLFPNPFIVEEREKYVVTINDKNYEVVATSADYITMASVDDDDILPQATIENFTYSIYNSQNPYLECVFNEENPRYVLFGRKQVQADSPLRQTNYIAGLNSLTTIETESQTNKVNEKYYQGTSNTQILADTNNPKNFVQGYYMRLKSIFRWGKKNRVLSILVETEEFEKTK